MNAIKCGCAIIFTALYGCAPHISHPPNRLNCILLGQDSLATYYGSSEAMMDRRSGRLSDPSFLRSLIKGAVERNKDSTLLIAVKPTAAGNVAEDFKKWVDDLNDAGLQNRSIDTLDEIERRVFQRVSLPQLTRKSAPPELILPRDDNQSTD